MSSKFILLILLIFSNIALVNSQTPINAREFYNLTYLLCESRASDIQMYNLQASDLDTSGKSQNWNYQLVSFQEKEVYFYTYQSYSVLLDTIMGIPIGPSVVDSNWINSDKAIFIAEQNGGKAYRDQNKNYQINADLCSRPSPPFYTYVGI